MMTLTMLLDPQLGLFFFLEVLERERRKKGRKLILEMLGPIKPGIFVGENMALFVGENSKHRKDWETALWGKERF